MTDPAAAPPPAVDWRRLKAIAGKPRWERMCRLALIVGRHVGRWGAPLTPREGEYQLRRWLAEFNTARHKEARFRAVTSLIEAERHTPVSAEFIEPNPPPLKTQRAEPSPQLKSRYSIELERTLAGDPLRPGPWLVEILDRLCDTVLEEAGAAAADSVTPDANQPPIPGLINQERRKPRPRPERERVSAAIRNDLDEKKISENELKTTNREAMAIRYNTSRHTYNDALQDVLSAPGPPITG
jgi:hypothetical protein